MTYVDKFAGTLAGVRSRLPYLRELGVTYLHLMPLLAARPAPNDGGYAVVDYGAVEPALGTHGRPRRAGLGPPRGRDGAVHRRRVEPRRGRASVGAEQGLPDHVRRSVGTRRVRAHAARGVPGHRPGLVLVVGRARVLALDDVQHVPVGPRLHEPRRVRGDGVGDARPRRGRGRRPPDRRRAVPVETVGDQLPEPARGPRAAGRLPGRAADRGAGRGLEGRGDRVAARVGAVPGRVRPRLPQRAHGPALERAWLPVEWR